MFCPGNKKGSRVAYKTITVTVVTFRESRLEFQLCGVRQRVAGWRGGCYYRWQIR